MSAQEQEYYQQQQAQQDKAHAQSLSAEQAARGSFTLDDFRAKDFVETAFSPDIERDESKVPEGKSADLEQKLAAEFGRHLGLSYISEEKADKEELLDQARANIISQGYARPRGMGSKVSDIEAKIKGQDHAPAELTSDMRAQISAAFEERSNLRRLSVDGRGWRGLTTVQTVTKSEGFGGRSSGGGGLLNKVTGGLFGGS